MKVIVFILCLFLVGCKNDRVSYVDKEFKNNLLDKISNYSFSNEEVDYGFLSYMYDTYHDDVMNRLLLSLEDGTYSDYFFYEATGKSLNVLIDYYHNNYDNSKNVTVIDSDVISLSFVGDVSLADNWYVMPEYDARGKGILGILDSGIVDIMRKASVNVLNNEFAFTDRGSKLDKAYTFRGSPSRVSIYKEMGVDLVLLANNHVYDYGEVGFLDTLDTLRGANIPYIGAGRNLEEASGAYYFIVNGYKIAFINATRAEKYIVTPGATDSSSGVFRCYDNSELIRRIKEEDKRSDIVVVLLHWGRDDYHSLEEVQVTTSKEYIDAGADLIVGGHAHVLQGMEIYKGKLIAYNLGDFIFNDWTTETGMLVVDIDKYKNFTWRFVPCLESGVYTKLLFGNDKKDLISKMNKWSINTVMDDDGYIRIKN